MKRSWIILSKKGFTLLEIMISIIWFSLLMVVILGMYKEFIHIKYNAQARSNLIERSYFAFEKINLLLKDYTIDYEEYFNRQKVWCNWIQTSFSWNVWSGWYCSNFSAYGNGNSLISNTWDFLLYYCSSKNNETSPNYPNYVRTWNALNRLWCAKDWQQSFGEYQKQFWDVLSDVDFVTWSVWDDDDLNLGFWPDALISGTWVQELYLISQDKTHRVLLRRALVESWNRDGSWTGNWDTNNLYTIQMLKLRWFDAGNQHNFSSISTWLYDGVIDTWACDYAQWFVCGWAPVGGAYSWFNLPKDSLDWRVNIFDRNLTISDWNISVFPTKNPDYAWANDAVQINPYFTISMTSKLYAWVWFTKLNLPSIDSFKLSLQTTFNIKNSYTK